MKNNRFQPVGLKRVHWKTASPIRHIFQAAFKSANLPYFNPHSFRNTLVGLAEKICLTPERFKAWSQNLGHENVMTTFTSYGEVSQGRQKEILTTLPGPVQDAQTIRITSEVIKALQATKQDQASELSSIENTP